MKKDRRVVITGAGLVTPAGITPEDNWAKIISGRTAIKQICAYDVSTFPVKLGGEIRDLDPKKYINNKRNIRFFRKDVHFCMAAARLAYEDSQIDFSKLNPSRIGLYVGSGESQTDYTMFFPPLACACNTDGTIDYKKFGSLGLRQIYPSFLLLDLFNNGFCYLSIEFAITGINNNFNSSLAGGHAIGEAFKAVQRGEIDIAMAGGYDSLVSSFETYFLTGTVGVFTREHDPLRSMKPYSIDRDGFVPSEGAGFIILEALNHAKERKAPIKAEILGYCCNWDGHRDFLFDPQARGLSTVIVNSLNDADVDPSSVGYINSDGNATVDGDLGETRAIKRVFGKRAYQIPVSTVKPVVGHLGAASSAIELIITILVLNKGEVPPSTNCSGDDPECDLDYVSQGPRKRDIALALSLNRGLGGQNCGFVLKKYSS